MQQQHSIDGQHQLLPAASHHTHTLLIQQPQLHNRLQMHAATTCTPTEHLHAPPPRLAGMAADTQTCSCALTAAAPEQQLQTRQFMTQTAPLPPQTDPQTQPPQRYDIITAHVPL
jgi:hypothetical protein